MPNPIADALNSFTSFYTETNTAVKQAEVAINGQPAPGGALPTNRPMDTVQIAGLEVSKPVLIFTGVALGIIALWKLFK